MRFNMLSESDSYLTQSVNKLELVSSQMSVTRAACLCEGPWHRILL